MPLEPAVAHQFEDATQQRDAATLGMWVFLATEVLFFGAMFLGYTVYRLRYPEIFRAASEHTLVAVGTINTGVLLFSSFTMVLAVRAAERKRRVTLVALLVLTAALGVTFLGIKAFEYAHEIHEGLFPNASFRIAGADPYTARMFFYLYFLMTGVHALHVTIGVVMLGIFALRALLTGRLERLTTGVDLLGLYWHFVDIVWVFLFPLIYLVGRHS
ncbi:MAG: cytochrome c oxidase subunit 3 family protein [Chthoniobacter sp.]|nr:cytochrome c oxidase subunit 3 family protein [Chthoniobacter sp.]